MKKLVAAIFISIFLVSANYAFAQDSATTSATPASSLKNKLQERLQKTQNKINKAQDKLQKIVEKNASREAALKEKLAKFKDKKKAKTAENINQRLSKINDKQTSSMLKHLTKMEDILQKLEARVGQNPSPTATAAIADAKTAIKTAKDAVEAQSQKDYILEITSESSVKEDAKTKRDALHADLKSTRKLVIDAKQAVAKAIMTAATGKESVAPSPTDGGEN